MFEQILGNEQNKRLLKQAIESKNILHSYMFVGKDGIGKFLFAKEFAKEILLGKSKQIEESNIPDLYIIEPEGNSIKIDQIRKLVKKVVEKPIASEKKIYIIKDSQLMTREAQNSLLKTLEEPPDYIVIILIASSDNLFLPTIKSRCTKIMFNKLSNKELEVIVRKKTDKNIIPEMLQAFDGSAMKALELINKQEVYTEVVQFIKNLKAKDLLDAINYKEKAFKDKEQAEGILDYMNVILINNAMENLKDRIKYANCIQIVEETKDRLRKNCNYDMVIDNCLISMWEECND